MKPMTVRLPDELDARLRREAVRRHIAVSQLTREAIESYLGSDSVRRILIAAGSGRSGNLDASDRIEELIRAGVPRRR